MRQNLLGSNLLNISLYNAANARLASSTTATAATENDYRYHPGFDSMGTAVGHGRTHPGMQYAMGSNIQLGYGLDGRPVKVGGYSGEMYGTTALLAGPSSASDYESDMYQFPPMNGMMDVGNRYEWHAPSMQYWDQVNMGPEEVQPQGGYPVEGEYYATHYDLEGGVPEQMEYRFSSLMETSGEGNGSLPKRAPGDIIAGAYVAYKEQEDRNPSSIRHWAGEGQQTPSGHVMFNEKLFDGVMGSAGLFDKAEGPDVLAIFDGAMEHAGEIASW